MHQQIPGTPRFHELLSHVSSRTQTAAFACEPSLGPTFPHPLVNFVKIQFKSLLLVEHGGTCL
jgi:hypothetical protein